jgi:hypothetical protein
MAQGDGNPVQQSEAKVQVEPGSLSGDLTASALLEKFTTPRASVGERMAAGKALRDKLPREK